MYNLDKGKSPARHVPDQMLKCPMGHALLQVLETWINPQTVIQPS